MFQVVAVLVVVGLLFLVSPGLSLNNETGTALRHVFRPYETTQCELRQTPGLICYQCDIVATCIRINDEWRTIPIAECGEGMFCNVRQGGCSDLAGPCNSIGHMTNFVCTSVGQFPDPYDCQKYHFCHQSDNSLGAINLDCEGNTAYDPKTGKCSLTLSSDICRFDQFTCDHLGQMAAWPGDDNIFYICKQEANAAGTTHLFPALYRCADNEVFDGSLCVRSDNGMIITSTTSPGTPFQCPDFGLFPFEGDCHSYYFCDNNLVPIVFRCPDGSYFEVLHEGCVRGECPDQQVTNVPQ